MIKDNFSSCKEAFHVKVYLRRKAIPNRPIKPVHIRVLPRSARQRNGEASFAVSPEITTTGCLRWQLLHIHISKLGKREVIYTLKSPAE